MREVGILLHTSFGKPEKSPNLQWKGSGTTSKLGGYFAGNACGGEGQENESPSDTRVNDEERELIYDFSQFDAKQLNWQKCTS